MFQQITCEWMMVRVSAEKLLKLSGKAQIDLFASAKKQSLLLVFQVDISPRRSRPKCPSAAVDSTHAVLAYFSPHGQRGSDTT